jgi:hypothetical protein
MLKSVNCPSDSWHGVSRLAFWRMGVPASIGVAMQAPSAGTSSRARNGRQGIGPGLSLEIGRMSSSLMLRWPDAALA